MMPWGCNYKKHQKAKTQMRPKPNKPKPTPKKKTKTKNPKPTATQRPQSPQTHTPCFQSFHSSAPPQRGATEVPGCSLREAATLPELKDLRDATEWPSWPGKTMKSQGFHCFHLQKRPGNWGFYIMFITPKTSLLEFWPWRNKVRS